MILSGVQREERRNCRQDHRLDSESPSTLSSAHRQQFDRPALTSTDDRIVSHRPEICKHEIFPSPVGHTRCADPCARRPSLEGAAGVRALALTQDGSLVDDFRIVADAVTFRVLNAPSPAPTASPAIGRHIAALAAERFGL